MKTIGLIGGVTWLSTLDYYRLLNEKVNQQFGGVESAKLILYSVNFAEIKILTETGQWDKISAIMCDAAGKLAIAGAECLLLCANTMHRIAAEVQHSIDIPLIHIAEAIGAAINEKGMKKIALLGTKYTMQLDFYKDKLLEQGIKTIIPNEEEIEMINTSIYTEMGKGIFLPERKQQFLAVMNRLAGEGAEGIILGCTEIPILIKQADTSIPLFDSTDIHASAAVAFALK